MKSDSILYNGGVTDEFGHFDIPLTNNPDSVMISALGFQKRSMSLKEISDTINLSPNTKLLNEIIVKGRKPSIKLSGSTIQVDIQKSALAKESNIKEVLRKIPGIVLKYDDIQTIDGAIPSIYLNGEKVASLSEIRNLDIKTIKTIELNTAPGARYSSMEKAVINIQTKKRIEGLALNARSYSRFNRCFTHDNSFNFAYKNKYSRFFGDVSYSDYRKHSEQDIMTTLGQDRYRIHSLLDGVHTSDKELTYTTGYEYENAQDLALGIRYIGSTERLVDKTIDSTAATLINQTDNLWGSNRIKDKTYTNHLNAYLQKRWNKKISSYLYIDFYNTHGDRRQSVDEQSTLLGAESSSFNNASTFTMISVKPYFEYKPKPKLTLEFGGNFINITGKSNQSANDNEVSKYKTLETTWAGFGTMKTLIKKINVQLGLRYEKTSGHLDNQIDASKSIKPSTSNFLGDLTISTKIGSTTHALTVKNSIDRPKFGLLNNYSYYTDNYSSQVGNPTLRPSLSYQMQYNFYWKFIYAALSYRYTKDYIGNYFYTNSLEPEKIKATWVNYHHNQHLQAVVNMQYTWGFYHPNITASISSDILNDERISHINNIPLVYVDFDNNLDLPWGINLNLEYIFNSKTTVAIFKFHPIHTFNVGLHKSFLNGNMDIGIKLKDMFGKDLSIYKGSINQIEFKQTEDQDRRALSINLTWRLNKNKHNYRGKSQSETINRL